MQETDSAVKKKKTKKKKTKKKEKKKTFRHKYMKTDLPGMKKRGYVLLRPTRSIRPLRKKA